MKIITFLNEKGGVGKTTCTANLAAELARRGHKTLLIDSDPQAHAALVVGASEQPHLYDLLVRKSDWSQVIQPISQEWHGGTGQLAIVTSNIETRAIPSLVQDAWAFDTRVRQLDMDIVVIDTPPTPSLLHSMIMLATDYVLIPTKAEYLGLNGVVKSYGHIEEIKARRQQMNINGPDVIGIIPTMFRGGVLEHKEMATALRERYGALVWNPIHQRTVWAESTRAHMPVSQYDPASSAALESYEVADRVEEVLRGTAKST